MHGQNYGRMGQYQGSSSGHDVIFDTKRNLTAIMLVVAVIHIVTRIGLTESIVMSQ